MGSQAPSLYEYNIWANGRVLEHLRDLPSGVFTQEVNLGFATVAEVFGHLVAADGVWLDRLRGGALGVTAVPEPFVTLDQADAAMRELQEQFRSYLAALADAEAAIVTYRNKAGQPYQNTLAEIIQHVVNHGTYHRGNITTMLRALGHGGPQTDYIAYVWKLGSTHE